jgi:FkbM family methyltransferase
MLLLKDVVHYLYLKWFKHKYKKTKIISEYFSEMVRGFYSQKGQDAFLYSEFYELINSGKISKTFVDIGCNHPINFSNSYFFEKHLGFECIAVDPLMTYKSHWAETRPKAKLFNVALGATKGKMDLFTMEDDSMASQVQDPDMFSTLSADNSKLRSGKWKTLEVPVLTAQELFDSGRVSEIGIVSIDVEGFEIDVLKGIDFSRTKVQIAIVENNTKNIFGSEEIRDFMSKNGFEFYARIWKLDDVYVNNDLLAH